MQDRLGNAPETSDLRHEMKNCRCKLFSFTALIVVSLLCGILMTDFGAVGGNTALLVTGLISFALLVFSIVVVSVSGCKINSRAGESLTKL